MNKEKLTYTKVLIEYVETHLSEDISAETLAKAGFVSRAKLYRDFYNIVGHSIKEYIRKRRLSNALALVKRSDFTLADIAYLCGYSSQQAFCRSVQRNLSMSPLEYKKSDRYYYFPPFLESAVFDVSVEHVTVPKLRCFYFYATKPVGIERNAVKVLLDLLPDYSGRIFGRNGRQKKNKFCYELYLSVEKKQIQCLEKEFEAGEETIPYIGLFAMTIVKDQEELINTAWEYLDKTWLTHSMYHYGEGKYFEEYIFRLGKPYKLRLYLPVAPQKDYPRIRLARLEQQTVIAAEIEGSNAEHRAAKAVLDYFTKYYPKHIKDLKRFYVQKTRGRFVYGIFIDGLAEQAEEKTVRKKVISQGMYFILEGETVGDYAAYKDLLTSFVAENGLSLADGDIFGVYQTDYGFQNPRLTLFGAVNMVNIETK
ncbi:MAG: helix-turn-helix transcriptional regulator [Lachnospiraceae bacterium]|nr:helix-turn-helix transcriptional regulator [Lachnospiraceae bacterium]